jgi:hypothetical protein
VYSIEAHALINPPVRPPGMAWHGMVWHDMAWHEHFALCDALHEAAMRNATNNTAVPLQRTSVRSAPTSSAFGRGHTELNRGVRTWCAAAPRAAEPLWARRTSAAAAVKPSR